MPPAVKGIRKGPRTETPQNTEQETFPVLPCSKQVDCGKYPCCKDDTGNTSLQGPLVTQGKIPAEMAHEMILYLGQVNGYHSNVLFHAKPPQNDCLQVDHLGMVIPLFVDTEH